MTLRDALDGFDDGVQLLILTTLGHVYVGSIVIREDTVTLARPDGSLSIALNIADISGVRELGEEPDG